MKVKSISIEDIGKIKIPLPPLSEQKRIVEILDLADNIAQSKKNKLVICIDEFQNIVKYFSSVLDRNNNGCKIIVG